ncbi:hypothetical protein D1871_22535 [Nakamurella silvestris]|nr:hypothetical protein D1871_22535 [Nakamurella silvestris]
MDGLSAGGLGVDYSGFLDAVGGEFGSRLHLVAYPPCATQAHPADRCPAPVRLGSTNDGIHHLVTVDLTGQQIAELTALSGTAAGTGGPVVGGPAGLGGVVFGAVADTAGPKGDFSASSLAPSGSWSVTGGSGGFDWSYPILAPPAGTGTTPAVALTYNSHSVDGRVASTNNQSSWLGEGWDYQPGFVERTYRTCVDVPGVPAQAKTGDLCWAGQVLTLSLGGSTVALVQDQDSGQWHPASDNGERVDHLIGAANGAHGGEYWKVTTVDGTQYFFGRNIAPGGTAASATNSVYTVPVFGAKTGDDCYDPAGFASSGCVQGWRWNLDYVQDVHGNAVVNYYTPEKNFYGRNQASTPVEYIRGGYLTRIEYGLHLTGGSVYGAPAAQRVSFTVAERCIPSAQQTCAADQFTTANAASWPDSPHDLACAAAGACQTHSPTFWSTKRLTYIKAAYYNTTTQAWVKVDEYRLGQSFNTTGDLGGQMTLNRIIHLGFAADGTSTALPPVDFGYTGFDNRVQKLNGEPAMPFTRMTLVTAETGAITHIVYGHPPRSDGGAKTGCDKDNIPVDPAANQMLCFPVRWTLPFTNTPILDYFHTWVVTSVDTEDAAGLSPKQTTTYRYLGAPAWHADDNEVLAPADRTFGQFRGYPQVETRTGNTGNISNGTADGLTLTRTSYLQGMGGSIKNSLGESITDADELAGSVYENASYNGAARLGTQLTDYTVVAATGSRPREGLPDLTSRIIRTRQTRQITDLLAGGTRQTATVSSYDDTGRVVAQSATGTGVDPACTTYRYAQNTQLWILNRVSEQITSGQTCTTPVEDPSPVTALSRSYFDGSMTLGQIPAAGDVTESRTATTPQGNTFHFARTTTGYDGFGRTITTTAYTSDQDATGRTTTTAYTPAGVGALTQLVTTNALGQKSTMKVTSGRGATWSSTDVAGSLTEAVYDQLGRLTSVYKPGQNRLNGDPATQTFTYLLRDNRAEEGTAAKGPSVVTTKTLQDIGTSTSYTSTTNLIDSIGQQIQTQTDAEDQKNGDGNSTGHNRVISDTMYDSHGWVVGTDNSWYTAGPPSTTVMTAAAASINDRSLMYYDLAGRQTRTRSMRGLAEISATATAYGGDRTTTVPANGGITTTNITDARGNISQVRQYTVAPIIAGNNVTGGTYHSTTYGYDLFDRMTGMTDAAGATWTYTYDLAGRRTTQNDPDAGTTSTTYLDTSEVATTTDARGITLTYGYDLLGRKTSQKSGATTLASWTYDTVRPGYLSSSNRYTAGNTYTVATTGYDNQGNPTGRKVTIPAAEGALKGTYITGASYSTTGQVLTETLPTNGDNSDEVINHDYTRLGRPLGMIGDLAYAIDTIYTPYGEVNQIALGVNNHRGWFTVNRDDHTRRVTDTALDVAAATPRVESMSYTYDDAGNITKTVDTQGGTDQAPVQTTCYTYNTLAQLTQAWSSSNACATTPSPSAYASVKGAQPFWTSWAFDSVGNRTTQINHPTAGKTGSTVTTYDYTTPGHQHSIAGATVTNPDNTKTNSTYTYNADGAVATRTQPGRTSPSPTPTTGAPTPSPARQGKPATSTTPTATSSSAETPAGYAPCSTDPTNTGTRTTRSSEHAPTSSPDTPSGKKATTTGKWSSATSTAHRWPPSKSPPTASPT